MKNPILRTFLFAGVIVLLYISLTKGTRALVPETWSAITQGVPEVQATRLLPDLKPASANYGGNQGPSNLAFTTKRTGIREWKLVVEYENHIVSNVHKEYRDWPSPTWRISE